MSDRILRAALTQTVNAFKDMPSSVDGLDALQGRLEEIRRANVAHHVDLMAEAARLGSRAICFGELFPGPYFAITTHPMWLGLAEDAREGPTVRELSEAARAHRMVVVAPIYELDSSTGKRFNTAVVLDEDGRWLGRFRKAHIPHGANEQGSFLEGFYYERSNLGSEMFPVFETSLGRIGVAICYDRHFAGAMWSLARHGAELVFCPAVTFGEKSQRMWHLEFPTDAARHNIFIGGSNRCGVEPPWNQPFFGESYFVGPNGVLPNLSSNPELVVADLDLDELSRPDPSGWNLKRDLRHDVVTRE